MALFYGQECPLCGVEMSQGDRLIATSHFIADPEHDLWRFSDAVMHWDCYATWIHRRRFDRMYFEANAEWSGNNPHWGIVYRDDRAFVTFNLSKTQGEVDVLLAETGSSFRIPLRDWEDWLGGGWLDGCHHEIEREAFADMIPLLRSRLPSADAVLAAVGMTQSSESAARGTPRPIILAPSRRRSKVSRLVVARSDLDPSA